MDDEDDILDKQIEYDYEDCFVEESDDSQDDPELPEEILKILYKAALDRAMKKCLKRRQVVFNQRYPSNPYTLNPILEENGPAVENETCIRSHIYYHKYAMCKVTIIQAYIDLRKPFTPTKPKHPELRSLKALLVKWFEWV